MKTNTFLQNKRKAVAAIFGIIIIVMLNNYTTRNDYNDLDRTISSIYQDRLKPAGYLFQINNHLYQKKLVSESAVPLIQKQQELKQHNNAIADVVKSYEATFLTEKEKSAWSTFKTQLQQYNELEFINSTSINQALSSEKMQSMFNDAIATLNSLNDIQASEGQILQIHSKSVLSGTILQSYFEISLLFILGIVILILIGISNGSKINHTQNHLLN